MIRNFIFDWSGTLVDDLPAVWAASNTVFRTAGVPELSLERFRAEFSLPFRGFYERFVPNIPMDQVEVLFHKHFHELVDTVRPLPHAGDILRFCHAHNRHCYILSTMRKDHFERQCHAAGFDPFFEATYAGVADKRQTIKTLLQKHDLSPGETLFVGDMQHDVDTAHHGGTHSCAVLTGYNTLTQLRESRPDVIVENLRELQAILETQVFSWPVGQSVSGLGRHVHPVPTVGALIFNHAGEVLMVRTRKWSDRWGMPGGKIQMGESMVDALRREIREETGLEIEDVRFEITQDCINPPEYYRSAHFVLVNYTCRTRTDGLVVLNDEAQEYKWVPLAEAFKLDLNQPTLVLLRHVTASPLKANVSR